MGEGVEINEQQWLKMIEQDAAPQILKKMFFMTPSSNTEYINGSLHTI